MAQIPLTVLRTELSLAAISDALRISPEDAIEKFQDARVTSWFAEIWGERLFNYTKHASANQAGSDAAIALGDIGRFDIGSTVLLQEHAQISEEQIHRLRPVRNHR